jgi:phosphotransferase system enzyme I (PtsI)
VSTLDPASGPHGLYRGFGVSPGIAIGKAVILDNRPGSFTRVPLDEAALPAEAARFDAAVAAGRQQLRELKERVASEVGATYAGVIDAQILMLDDASFSGETRDRILQERGNAEWALGQTVNRFRRAFSSIEDPYIRERAHDVEDVHNRLQKLLAGAQAHDLANLSEDSIVVSPSISPSDTILLKHPHVVGFCTDLGGRTSHTAIIANALEIPAVIGLHDISAKVRDGATLVLDGGEGVVWVDPPDDVVKEYREKRGAYARMQAEYAAIRDLPGVTADGQRVVLRANIELPDDIESALRFGAEGVGLYRSEFLFLERSPALPTEEEHYRVYRMLAERCAPQAAVVRTLDLGGEKYFHAVLDRGEANPVMGMRAVRFCLKRPDIFKAQLRGLLRASAHGRIQVMFPLISGVDELRRVRAVLEACRRELQAEGVPVAPRIEVGIMIEVPSAAAISDLLAREVDFFSVGTNDLIQYCLALDRGNDELGYLYEPLHPAILRTLEFVVRSGDAAGIRVALCGEMAAEPRYLAVLLGLGFRELSMNPQAIPGVKRALGAVHAGRARQVMREALSLPSTRDIEALVKRELLADGMA